MSANYTGEDGREDWEAAYFDWLDDNGEYAYYTAIDIWDEEIAMEECYKNGTEYVPPLPPAPPGIRRRMEAPTVPSTVEAEPVEHVKRGKSQASRTTDH